MSTSWSLVVHLSRDATTVQWIQFMFYCIVFMQLLVLITYTRACIQMLKRNKRREIARAVDQIQSALGREEEEEQDKTTATTPSPSPFPPTSSKKKLTDESKIIRKPGNEISISTVTRTIPVVSEQKKKNKTPPGMMRVISGATFTGANFNFGGPNENLEQQIIEQLKMPHNQQAKVTYVPINDNNNNRDGGGDSLDATIAQLNELVDGGIDIPPPLAKKKKVEPPSTLDEWDKIAGRLCP
jgi:hypothetical protein